MDIGSFTSLASSLKAAIDIAKGAVGVRDHAKLQGLLTELQEKIISAQSSALTANASLMEVLQKNRELEQRLAEVEDWRTVAARYELVDFGSETFAYRLRPESANREPTHLICPACYAKRQRSILQGGTSSVGQRIMRCSACDKSFYLGTMRHSHDDYPRGGGSAWSA